MTIASRIGASARLVGLALCGIAVSVSGCVGGALAPKEPATGSPTGEGGTTGEAGRPGMGGDAAAGTGWIDAGASDVDIPRGWSHPGPSCAAAPCLPGTGTVLVGSSGTAQTCALHVDGFVDCWGSNADDALGLGTAYPWADTPVRLASAGQSAGAAVGDAYTCFVSPSGTTQCRGHLWGAPNGVDGGGDPARPPNPWTPPGLESQSVRLIAGGSHATCVVTTSGAVRCWGGSPAATPVAGLDGATALAVGFHHACAVLPGGSVRCWGASDLAQLGVSQGGLVSGVDGATAIAAGGYHTCAIVAAGKVKCWGYNPWGQLGAVTSELSPSAVEATGIAGASAIAAGEHFTCAIVAGSVLCWGADPTSLEAGVSSSTMPRAVAGIQGATSLAAGNSHVCAVVDTGAVMCWGYATSGQLGPTVPPYHASGPVQIVGWP